MRNRCREKQASYGYCGAVDQSMSLALSRGDQVRRSDRPSAKELKHSLGQEACVYRDECFAKKIQSRRSCGLELRGRTRN